MSKAKKQPIGNAAGIIEMFGGIRPMSAKVNVAVTTIQGWKKRDAIPAVRKDVILDAAKEHAIDLSEFFSDAPSIDVDVSDVSDASQDAVKDKADNSFDISIPNITKPAASGAAPIPAAAVPENETVVMAQRVSEGGNYTEISVESKRRGVSKNTAMAVVMIVVFVGAVIAMMLPNRDASDARKEQLAVLDGDLGNENPSAFKGLVPENWSRQLDDLKAQVSQAKQAANDVVESVQVASQKFVEDNGLEERVVQLQSYVSEIADENGIYGLFTHFEGMDESDTGRDYLDDSVLELSDILGRLSGKEDSYVNNAIYAARAQSAALNQTLGNVPKNELKAAAMLLALTQVRSALNRRDEAFDDDLGLLMGMVGDGNGDLYASLEKLAPHSKSGVLSVRGLQEEFRSVAGDVVAASLRGEDVSFSEQASARLNDILQIEVDGELVSGTKTQVNVDKASKMLALGNIDDAVEFLLKQLNSKELAPLRPWIKRAKIALVAKKARRAIEQAIDLSIGSGLLGGSQLLNDDD
ncbi:MAG: hypothetical protein COA45_08635 [Zetaproteobacteria bacterium]|nr:MAG: hypothetical protein COA45_08635 [Zetaproteobacteria bacterium]